MLSFFTARRSFRSRNSACPSVGLSVRLSHACFLTKLKNLPAIFYTAWTGNPSSFLPPNSRWWTTSPSTFNGRSKWPTPFKNRSRRQISACKVSTVRASEKSSIMTNRKSYTGFPTSYRWSAYVTSKSPKKGGSKSELFLFGIKVNFTWMKSATKFLWQKTSSGKAVVHSFPYLTVHRCWGNTNPSTSKWRTALTKRWIGDISACSSSAVTAS